MSDAALPELSEPYPISAEQSAQFQRDGFILLHGVAAPEEAAAYRRVIRAAVERFTTERRPIEQRDTYGKAFLQVMNLWERDEAVRRFVFSRRFARIAAELMGVEGVRLYHAQALYKEPHGGHTPWHQDQYYWPLDSEKTITLWMPLVDLSLEMGPMIFAAGSHGDGSLGHLEISDTSHATFERLVAERGYPLFQSAMAAGDATFHAGWTLHSASPNTTDRMREVMTVIYMADGIRVSEPDNPGRVEDLRVVFPGLQPGDLAASPLNPLLYSR